VVVFIDILGWKSIVEKSVANKSLRMQMHNAIHSLGMLTDEYVTEETVEHPSEDEFTQFSDSIIISFPYTHSLDVGRLIRLVSGFQSTMLLSGFLVRGGITVGLMFHQGRIAFGPAVNRAYDLESKIACFPRVVIDPELEKTVQLQATKIPKHHTFVRKDNDGYLYPEYLMVPARSPAASKQTSNLIASRLAAFADEPVIFAKYQWLHDRWTEALADAPWRVAVGEKLETEFWKGRSSDGTI
jgi:hypothetical protein